MEASKMSTWTPTAEQARQFEEDGYFIVRNVIPQASAAECRGGDQKYHSHARAG